MSYKYDYSDLRQQFPKYGTFKCDQYVDEMERIAPLSAWLVVGIFDIIMKMNSLLYNFMRRCFPKDTLPAFTLVAPPVSIYYPEKIRAWSPRGDQLELMLRYVYNEFDPNVPFFEALYPASMISPEEEVPHLIRYLVDRPDRLRFHAGADKEDVEHTASSFFWNALQTDDTIWHHGSTVLSPEQRAEIIIRHLRWHENGKYADFIKLARQLLDNEELRSALLRVMMREGIPSNTTVFDSVYLFWFVLWDPEDEFTDEKPAVLYGVDDMGHDLSVEVRKSSLEDKVLVLGRALRNYGRLGGNVEALAQSLRKHVNPPGAVDLALSSRYQSIPEKALVYTMLYNVVG